MMKAIIFSFLIGVTITIKSVKPENLYSLTVTVNNLRNSDGTMIFALYNENGSIPDQKFKKYYRKETVRIVGKKSEITFNNLPQGLGTGQLYTNNLDSPLHVNGGLLKYESGGEWDLSLLGI